ncbi:MAG: MBL fold metallo-hydrolase [Methanosphaera sp. rholeuAM130]|nr:MBL fold metallo-hydrolase [Methanosphaera sp.]RAP53577.1 MAG: MBL fold metallo-hydrolase [Methanosphaera sp. rholeuAM130]
MDKVDDIIIILGRGRDSNSYVIGETLIDPGSGFDIDYLKAEIKEAGLEMEDIKRIVNTHCHYDHMGADKQLQDEYGYEIYMHPLDKKSVDEKLDDTTVATSFGMTTPDLDIKQLNEGDMVEDFEVIHTPGHTRGGICLCNGKSLISGDTVFSGGNFGRTDLPTGDSRQMAESILKIADLDVVQLFPGHGPYAISQVSEQIALSVMIASRL